MSNTIKIGIIGCGKLAQSSHIGSFVNVLSDEVKIIAVADINEHNLAEAKNKAGAEYTFRDYKQLIALDEIEAVSIVTPTSAHMQPTVDALNAGKHVLCEKPMAMNKAECDKMVEAADRNGKLLMIEQALRFNALFETLKAIVETGKIGRIFMLQCVSGHGGPGKWNPEANWFMDKARGGGVLMDMGVHEVDFMRWVTGKEIIQAGGMTRSFEKNARGADENSVAIFRFSDGTLGSLATSWAMRRGERKVTIYGTKGHLALDSTAEKKVTLFSGGEMSFPEIQTVSKFGPGRAYAHFINCLKGLEECICPGSDACNSVAAIEAAYKSAETNGLISL
jgi:predicted dehydrogenase